MPKRSVPSAARERGPARWREDPTVPPRDVVVVLLDSLNRHMLGCYGGTEFDTPNLDRLAARSVRFTNHHTGSLPCMPARHDLLVGALDFPWRPWGSIEIWEDAVTHLLRRDAGVSTMLVSDHPHLFETGGENYHTDFAAWDYVRGHEDDPWRTRPDPSWIGAPALPAAGRSVPARLRPEPHGLPRRSRLPRAQDDDRRGALARSRARCRARPGRTALLVVDEFDPHEPFDTPDPWASRYDPDWDGPRLIWPPYARSQEESGLSGTGHSGRHLRSAVRIQALMIRSLASEGSCRSSTVTTPGTPPRSFSAPITVTISVSAACGASRRCPSTPRWATSR